VESPFPNRSLGRGTLLMNVILTHAILLCGLADARGPSLANPHEKSLPAALRKAARTTRPMGRHFAEIEVVLSATLTLDDLLAMPHAPGSHVDVLEEGMRAKAQLPAPLVGDLIERGEAVVVMRDFMLLQRFCEEEDAGRQFPVSVAAECSGDSIEASNGTDYPIPESEWIQSDIAIEEAPADAVVTCIDVHFEIVHPLVADLWVDVSDEGLTHEYNLWFVEGGFDANISETVAGIGEFAGERANQVWSLWATDVVAGYDGYIDYWWIKVYYEEQDIVPEHDEPSEAAVVEKGIPFHHSTVGATGGIETRCGYQDRRDVWHVYTPAEAGLITAIVESAEFDTTLAVYDPCGVELACSDDNCDSTNSVLTMPVQAGGRYLIRVAGYDDETGDYSLVVRQPFLASPEAPDQPSPADGGGLDALPVVLSWNADEAATTALVESASVSRLDSGRAIQTRTIYGDDDRREEYEISDARALAVGAATAMLLYREDVLSNGDGTYRLQTNPLAWWYEWLDPIDSGNSLCDDEPFRDQPSVGTCTGVLVGADVIATAGHCVSCLDPSDIVVVFGFVMNDVDSPVVTLTQDQVYEVAQVLDYQAGYPDWGLLRLDRAVTDRKPLALRRAGRVADGQPVLVVGHPWGIPRKYGAGAIVCANDESTFFQANLDTYRGHSGSPVVNLDSMVVEGLLVRGMQEFVEDSLSGCDRSAACPDGGCLVDGVPQWQDVTRTTTFSAAVPVFDVYLGAAPDDLHRVAANLTEPRYEPGALQKEAVYYWQVISRNVSGQTAGPIWSFQATLSLPIGVTRADRLARPSQ